jgi:hypothetical protein
VVAAAVAALMLVTGSTRVLAQAAAPGAPSAHAPAAVAAPPLEGNAGRLSFSSSVDVISSYYFRGFRQDDTGLIAWPAVDGGVNLFEGDGALKSARLNVGLWNSLHSGPAGSAGPSGKMWYEADFYSSLTLGLAGGLSVGTTYTAYMSPNSSFGTIKEVSFTVAAARRAGPVALAPYAVVAFELDGQADGGSGAGTYMELGARPELPLLDGRVALAFPLKVGLSLRDYYEAPGGSRTFGYTEAGAVVTVPIGAVPQAFGKWSVRGGVSLLSFGDALQAYNGGQRTRAVGLLGVALSY